MMILRLLLIWMMMVPVFAVAASASASALEHFEGDLSVVEHIAPEGTCFRMEKFNPDTPSHMKVVSQIEDEGNPYYDMNEAEIRRKQGAGYYDVSTPFGDYIFFKNGQPIGTCGLAIEGFDRETDALEESLRGSREVDPFKEYERPLEELSLSPEILYKLSTLTHEKPPASEWYIYANISIYLDPDNRLGGIGKIMNHMLRHGIIDPLVGKTCDFPMARERMFVTGKTSIPFKGSLSLVALDNLPSLGSQLAGDEVSLYISDQDSAESMKGYVIFYPPQPEKSFADHLILAKEIIAMGKAHRAAAAHGSGSASSS